MFWRLVSRVMVKNKKGVLVKVNVFDGKRVVKKYL